jgi:hypothetical protein
MSLRFRIDNSDSNLTGIHHSQGLECRKRIAIKYPPLDDHAREG